MHSDFQPDNIWFTADHHFFHAGILHRDHGSSRADRWNTVDQMHASLIEQWNDTVGRRDIVYSIGDLFFRVGMMRVLALLNQLSGFRIVLLCGNHDNMILRKLSRQGRLPKHVSLVSNPMDDYIGLDRRIDGQQVFLRHYPELPGEAWPGQASGTILLHGHSHGNREERPRALDVGWDVHGRLLSFEDVESLVIQ